MSAVIRWIALRIRAGAVLPWIVLGIGLAASGVGWMMLRDNIENVAEERFDHQATEATQVIERRVLSYAEVLFGARALFATRDRVSRLEFHRFVESLDLKSRFPGFDQINYSAYVRPGEKERFVQSVRRDTSLDPSGYPQFSIKPPGERPGYYVLVYLEPMAGFESAFGLDIGANPALGPSQQAMAAVQQSGRDTGTLTASGLPIPVKTASREYVGLGMRLPVYRKDAPLDTVEQRRAAYLGSVGAGFNVESLLSGVLEEKTTRYMRFRVYGPAVEGRATSPSGRERLLFDSNQLTHASVRQPGGNDPASAFARVMPMEIAGRTWEVRFRLIAENASDLITVIDTKGTRVYANPAYGKLFGDARSLIGSDMAEYIHPDDQGKVRESFLETLSDGHTRHSVFRFLLPDGEVRYIESYRSAVLDAQERVEFVVAVARDVTERRRTEEALRARDVQLQEAQGVANLGSWEWDLRTNSRTWSDQLSRIFGLRPGQMPSTFDGFYPLVHAEDRERTAHLAREALRSGKSYENQFRIVRPDGTVRTVHNQARVDRDESGKPVRVIGVCQDITERKLAEEQARVSQERFRMMVENVRDYAIYMLDMKGYITSWNLGAERIEGYLAEEIIGRHYSCFFPPDHAARGDPGMQLQFAAIQGRYESEGWRVRKNGSQFWAHVILTPLLDEAGKLRGFSEIVHDITERKRAEEDLHSYADRLKTTSRRLVEVQESERRMLATELHDRVGQNLTALGINLSIVAGGMPAGAKPELAARLEECG